jgi:hypothetical protein
MIANIARDNAGQVKKEAKPKAKFAAITTYDEFVRSVKEEEGIDLTKPMTMKEYKKLFPNQQNNKVP